MQSKCYITMVLELFEMLEFTITGLGNLKIWSYMVVVYINSLGIIKIYCN